MDALDRAEASLRRIVPFFPTTAVVLGTGLGDFADKIEQVKVIEYKSIPGFPISTAPDHAGRMVYARLENGKELVVMQGRVHYYEGYTSEEVVFPIRVLRRLGVETVVLTNAAGGINEAFAPGDFMLITDHIGLAPNPLIGRNLREFGPRFPDCSRIYHPELQSKFRAAAVLEGIVLRQGVYVQTTGPSFETPAEIRFFRTIGADAVGMSTAVEAIAAVHAGMRVAGLSCITNLAAGMTAAITSEEVSETTARVGEAFARLLITALMSIDEE
ncbi:MAG: purine-nucleoside phosphorylase [Clostridiales bacterium]|jgi:purine-nucleoside phosphorylase|nr:purine-nucleoside phosphorylase [Clostridiales bacterium]